MFDPTPQHNMWNPIPPHAYSSGFPMMGSNVYGGMTRAAGLELQQQLQKADTISGFGQLTWLSAKAGLITCKNKMIISFQIKDFCDQMLSDLTHVLRVGFTLFFQASLNESHEYTATSVSPLYGQDAEAVFGDAVEVDLESVCPTPANAKDAYDPILEGRAITILLNMFLRQGMPGIQLSSMHSQMSNCGEDDLFRYVGTSSLKRRQFIERRTHIFQLNSDDSVQLQHPAIYLCILRLASYMLRRGGATAIQSLYEYYTGPEMAQEIRDYIGDGSHQFLQLIASHPWIFAVFPSRIYVSVRRNLPHFDYPTFVKKLFPKMDQHTSSVRFPPHTIVRSMSAHQPLGSFTDRPMNLFHGSEALKHSNPITLGSTPASRDQWSPLPSPWMRSDFGSVTTPASVIGSGPVLKSTASVGVQTEPMRNESGSCFCGCSCAGGRLASSRASGGSISPPSLESTSSSGEHLSPGAKGSGNEQPIKYYDPFGTDIITGLNAFSFN